MHEGGFFERKRQYPASFLLVVAGHVAALAAVMMIKGPDIVPKKFSPLVIHPIEAVPPQDPPPPPPEPRKEVRQLPQQPSRIDQIPPVIDRLDRGPIVIPDPYPPLNFDRLPQGPELIPQRRPEPVAEPVRIEARVDPRYADALQPPYPPSEQRAQREGQVRLRVTIGTDGRVKAVERLSATSDAFWSVAERHARNRWRFRPATLDGRPVESDKVMTLHFRLENA